MAAILMAAIVASAFFWVYVQVLPRSVLAPRSLFIIERGWGVSRVAHELERGGIIRSRLAMMFVMGLRYRGQTLKAGSYELSSSDSTIAILDRIIAGNSLSNDIEVTIPEGMNIWQVDAILAGRSLIPSGAFARVAITDEGYLFPDTYRFDARVASKSGTDEFVRTYHDTLKAAFADKASVFTREQIVIASMLEKEAKSTQDMQLVAGIIAHRRKLGMPLQLDATVAYGWCMRQWQGVDRAAGCDVTDAPIAREILRDGPYNTYTRLGLPIGPISSPGIASLEAAANPQESEYLYYLSTRDGSRIIFSKTLAEHNRNRTIYLGL